MARNIFEFLKSNEIKEQRVDNGIVMVYHSNYVNGRVYQPGSFVRYNNGVTFDTYIAIVETSNEPIAGGWEMISTGVALPWGNLIDNGGFRMVDSSGLIMKAV